MPHVVHQNLAIKATGKILEKRKHSQIRVLEILEVRQEGKPILTTDLFHRTAELQSSSTMSTPGSLGKSKLWKIRVPYIYNYIYTYMIIYIYRL